MMSPSLHRRPAPLPLPPLAACLFACMLVAGCGGVGATGGGPAESVLVPSPTESLTLPPATPTPTPAPTSTRVPIQTKAWTSEAVVLREVASDAATVQVHLGADFPVTMTLEYTTIDGQQWQRVAWQTSGRSGAGWLPTASVTIEEPDGATTAGMDAFDDDLEDYLEKYGSRIGVEVLDVTRGISYSYNADKGFLAASSMKVPIMLTLLSQLEAKKREPTSSQLRLLTQMIEVSSNSAARTLYDQVGDKAGVTAYLKKIGVGGINPALPYNGFGYSLISPAGMVSLLEKLRTGAALNEAHTALALKLMSNITPHQRIGVGDNSPAGAKVAMKDGWVGVNDGSGTIVMNSSGIVTVGDETYIVAVYTDRDRNWAEGWTMARHVCKAVGRAMVPTVAGS